MFQSQGRFFGGATDICAAMLRIVAGEVSIAGAILWGEQPRQYTPDGNQCVFQSQGRFFGGSNRRDVLHANPVRLACFNRRGDSFGGAT